MDDAAKKNNPYKCIEKINTCHIEEPSIDEKRTDFLKSSQSAPTSRSPSPVFPLHQVQSEAREIIENLEEDRNGLRKLLGQQQIQLNLQAKNAFNLQTALSLMESCKAMCAYRKI